MLRNEETEIRHGAVCIGWRRVVDLLRTYRWKIYDVTGSKEMSVEEESE